MLQALQRPIDPEFILTYISGEWHETELMRIPNEHNPIRANGVELRANKGDID